MKNNSILEAALIERQEYLEELSAAHELIEQQIEILKLDVDTISSRILESSK